MTSKRLLPVPWLLALVALQPLRAQERFSVGPMVGLYFATSSFVGPANPPTASRSYKHAIAPVLGAQGTYWLSSHAGIGATVAWSTSDVREATGSTQVSTPAAVTLLAGFLALRVNSLEQDNAFQIRLGIAQVAHHGEFFEPFGEPRNLAGVFGIDAALPIGSHLSGGGGVDAYVYPLELTSATGLRYEKRTMIDAVARVGIAWTFGAR